MQLNQYYALHRLVRLDRWNIIKKRYQYHVMQYPSYSFTPRIPKIIHQIWLGGSLPGRYEKLQKTWQENHPDWHYILWTEDEIEALGLINKHAYDQASNYGQKSDIARYEILYRMGGLYVDTDFECIKAFDNLHHQCDFYAGLSVGAVPTIINALIGVIPRHPIIKTVITSICEHSDGGDDVDMMETLRMTGPLFFTEVFFSMIDQCNGPIVIFPTSYFYPISWHHCETITEKNKGKYICPETYALHYWHASWV